MNLVVKWYKRDVRKQRFQVRYWVVSYISSFFFNLVEKNLLRVKKFSKCRENGIACLRKGKLPRQHGGTAARSKATGWLTDRLLIHMVMTLDETQI